MKKVITKMKGAVIIMALAALALPGCNDDDDDELEVGNRTVTVQLSGANEVPPVTTSGSGSADIDFDPAMKMISYTINWTLGSASTSTVAMHFHGAENGSDTTSSPVVIGINGFSTGTSGTLSGMTRELTDAEVNQLLAGKWYLNIHSDVYPAGEIRGNIKFP